MQEESESMSDSEDSMSNNDESKPGWTWGHIGGVFGGTVQIFAGGTLILITGGAAAPFVGNALISSGFSGVQYSLTTDEFSAMEYGGKCATSAATSMVFFGVGAAVKSVAETVEIGATVVNVINKNPTAANLLSKTNKIVEGSEYIKMAGKGASIALDGATQAVEQEFAAGFVESVKERDISGKRLREKMDVANVGPAAAFGSAASLLSSGIGHFQGKKLKPDEAAGFSGATQGSLRAKDLVYKLKGRVGKQILKDLGKGIDAALKSMATEAVLTACSTKGKQLPSKIDFFMAGSRGAVYGGVGSRDYHQQKHSYLSALQQKACLKTIIAKLQDINATADSKEINNIIKERMAQKAEIKRAIKDMEPRLGLKKNKINEYKKKQQAAGAQEAQRVLEDLNRYLDPSPRPEATM